MPETQDLTRALEAQRLLEAKLRPIMEAILAPLVRAGVRAPGDPSKLQEPGPIGSPNVTYDEGGGRHEWGVYTQADHDRYAKALAQIEAGRVIDPSYVPERGMWEAFIVHHHVETTTRTALDALTHLISLHTSYPGHENCSFPSPLGSDLLALCIRDEDIEPFLCETILDPRNFRSAMSSLRESYASEAALFKLLLDLIGIDFVFTA